MPETAAVQPVRSVPTSFRQATTPIVRWSIAVLLAAIAGAALFGLLHVSIFNQIGMPHEVCYLQDPRLIALHVTSDLLIGIAYVSISATLAYLVYRASRDIPFHSVFLAFGLFIVSCGITHFMEVWVIWQPVYWLSGYMKVVTAAASLATAIALFPLVPKVFRVIDATRQSERRRLEIEQLNNELERFNYSVAHDLRAPLRGIRGFGQALREDCGEQLTATGRSYIAHMERSAADMDTLITNLLKYATIGRQELVRRPVPLEDGLRSAQWLLDAEIRRTHAQIRVPRPLPRVMADSALLEVVFVNLLGNAIKFIAPETRPEVEITSEIANGLVTVSVIDNGLGVPADAREKIFHIFERYHVGVPGTGIGLALVHRAIERMDGRIGIEAAPGDGGSRFWFQLPAG
jgi:signal transduction histidine kinase